MKKLYLHFVLVALYMILSGSVGISKEVPEHDNGQSPRVRGDVLYLPDNEGGRSNGKRIQDEYHLHQEIIYWNFDKSEVKYATPVRQVPPVYPKGLLVHPTTGKVDLIFIVDEFGAVSGVFVKSVTFIHFAETL